MSVEDKSKYKCLNIGQDIFLVPYYFMCLTDHSKGMLLYLPYA